MSISTKHSLEERKAREAALKEGNCIFSQGGVSIYHILAHSLPFTFPLTGEASLSSVMLVRCVCELTRLECLCGICKCSSFQIFHQICLV